MASPLKSPSGVVYRERLYVAWWAWLLPIGAAALLAAAVVRGFGIETVWLPPAIGVALAVLLLVLMSRLPVLVDAGTDGKVLQVAHARLPARFIADVEVVTGERKRTTMGPELDPRAYVVHRAWIPSMLKVTLNDPDDETPYWLFSTRRPERLAELLRDG